MTHAAGAATAAVPGGDDRVGAALTPAIHAGDTPPEATRTLDGRGDAPVPRAKSPGVQRWSKFPASLRDELPRPPSPGHETHDAGLEPVSPLLASKLERGTRSRSNSNDEGGGLRSLHSPGFGDRGLGLTNDVFGDELALGPLDPPFSISPATL